MLKKIASKKERVPNLRTGVGSRHGVKKGASQEEVNDAQRVTLKRKEGKAK